MVRDLVQAHGRYELGGQGGHGLGPSQRREGVPVTLMEAMAARLPVVTTLVGGIPELVEDGVSGYLFKKGSPSCGMERVRIYKPGGEPAGVGAGMFAATIMRERPELPVEEEGRLMDAVLRENFVERVFVYHRWQRLCRGRPGAGELVDFHTRHKLIVLSHDETAYRELGRLVAEAGKADLEGTLQHYIRVLMRALKKNATPKQHANILMHILGFFKRQLATADKAELLDLIDAYRRSQVPLVVPITLIKHHLRHYPDDYLSQQYYLNPHPRELMLRNHI